MAAWEYSLTFPLANAFAGAMGTLFPVFFVGWQTILMQLGAAFVIGVVAACVPAWRAARVRIVDGTAFDCMMAGIPLNYIARNLTARKLTTLLTAGGMALVVYVFATVLMLAAGLRETLVATGQPDNIVVIRRGSQTEVQSGVDRPSAAIVETLPDIATGAAGERLISKETVVLTSTCRSEIRASRRT